MNRSCASMDLSGSTATGITVVSSDATDEPPEPHGTSSTSPHGSSTADLDVMAAELHQLQVQSDLDTMSEKLEKLKKQPSKSLKTRKISQRNK